MNGSLTLLNTQPSSQATQTPGRSPQAVPTVRPLPTADSPRLDASSPKVTSSPLAADLPGGSGRGNASSVQLPPFSGSPLLEVPPAPSQVGFGHYICRLNFSCEHW